MSSRSQFGGSYRAFDFAYGINPSVAPLIVNSGPAATGSGTLIVVSPQTNIADGTILLPLNTNAPINVGSNSGFDTNITPSAVSVTGGSPPPFATSSVTGTFTFLHGQGDLISSATVGLQEALNFAGSVGGGNVIVDKRWVLFGGTQAMIAAATFPAGVGLIDNRFGANFTQYTYTLTNAQILSLSSTPVQLLPAPGTNSYWQVNTANLINLCTGTAYTAGGAITIGYGSTTPTNALSGTIAATFLTTPTATQVIELGSGLTTAGGIAATNVLNKGIFINNASANFTTGTGTLQVVLNVSNILT